MGLVDYSDSEGSGSEAEAPAKPLPKPANTSSKKSFQKVVDRSKPGKIVLNLPQVSADIKTSSDEPPTKRAKTGGNGRFSGFNSFLPPPKNLNQNKTTSTASSSRIKPGVNLRTSAAPGFSRDANGEEGAYDDTNSGNTTGGMILPAPKTQAQPTIPEGQTPAEEVKLVGKPLMFKPLSVARGKKKAPKVLPVPKPVPIQEQNIMEAPGSAPAPAPKVSLFSLHSEEPLESEPLSKVDGAYEPLFAADSVAGDHDSGAYGDYVQYANAAGTGPSATTAPGSESLDNIADDLNLTAAQRRELFGRGGVSNQGAKRVINFNMDKEYQHNEDLRAKGEEVTHNPVRAIQGGKHSLRQLVQNVHNQREALEDTFAKGKSNRKEASGRYGW